MTLENIIAEASKKKLKKPKRLDVKKLTLHIFHIEYNRGWWPFFPLNCFIPDGVAYPVGVQ